MRGDLAKAARLFKRRKYADIIRMLEPQIFRFRESFPFYKLLGYSCLYTGDLAGAYSYLRRANQLKEEDVEALLAIAVIHLRRQELTEAIEHWLAVQDLQPRNRFAARGLDLARKNPAAGREGDLDSRRIAHLLPRPSRLGQALPYLGIAALVALAVIFVAIPFAPKLFPPPGPPRPGLAQAELQSTIQLVQPGGQFRYVLTVQQIRSTFNNMRTYFADYHDNLTQREINRLLGSNASQAVKEKARILESYLRQPNFATFRDPFSYQEVAKHPYLYRNCYVDWKGMVSNLRITTKEISFDFLVGYNEQKVLEGIVPVTLDFAANIRTAMPLELLAQVKTSGDHIVLRGISVHQLMPPGS